MQLRAAAGPVLAGAAIVVIAVVAIVIRGPQPGGTHGHGTGVPVAGKPLPAGTPPYYLTIADSSSGGTYSAISVRSTATGALLHTVKPPAGYLSFDMAAGTADDTKFVVALSRPTQTAYPPERFFLLTYHPDTRTASVSPLPVPVVGFPTSIAVSPDGRYLAVAESNDSQGPELQVRVYDLVTGAKRSWSASAASPDYIDQEGWLSWASDDKTLFFRWDTSQGGQSRLLNTSLGGSGLLQDSRRIEGPINSGFVCTSQLMLNPNGAYVLCGGYTAAVSNGQDRTTGFAEFSATTGKLITILDARRENLSDSAISDGFLLTHLYWSSPDASILIGVRDDQVVVYGDGAQQVAGWVPTLGNILRGGTVLAEVAAW